MDVVEPYLLQLGFLDRTLQGRVATKSAYEHLVLTYAEEGQQGCYDVIANRETAKQSPSCFPAIVDHSFGFRV